MVLGILQFELLIHDPESLKDKRRVVRSVKDRLHREHQVSVAEVAALDKLNIAVLGLACVGTDGARIGEVLDHVTEKLRALPDAELGDVSRQILHGSEVQAAPDADPGPDADDIAREMLARFDDEGDDGAPL